MINYFRGRKMESFIEWLIYLFLGVLQGITEPLPISSSGHLLIARSLLNIGEMDVFFEIMVHFASFFAVAFLLREKIIELIKGLWLFIIKKDVESKESVTYVLMLVVASVPVGVFGILLRRPLERFLGGSSLLVVGLGLIVTAGLLWSLKYFKDESNYKLSIKDSIFIGLFQALAIVPGVSRSGSTIAGGIYRKINIKELFEFSFLLYLPVTFAAGLLEIFSIQSREVAWLNLSTAFIVSMFVTYLALKWFRSMAFQGRFKGFAIYCLSLGLFAIILYLV
jgi:undecaprenyl-diphosphatase